MPSTAEIIQPLKSSIARRASGNSSKCWTNIIAGAGDLIESRSPELVAQARSALRRYTDESHGRLNDAFRPHDVTETHS
jgi:hypothetical protein